MAVQSIAKKDFSSLLAKLAKERALYAPVVPHGPGVPHGRGVREGVARFARVEPSMAGEEVDFNWAGATASPKELFLPSRETLYAFTRDQAGDQVTDTLATLGDEQRVVVGVRPCDARALALLDAVFDAEDVKDPFYVTRREKTTIVALACNEPRATCLCASVGGDPFGKEGADVLLVDTGDAYTAEALTEKGKELLATLLDGVKTSKPKAGAAKRLAEAARKKLAANLTDLAGTPRPWGKGLAQLGEKLASVFDSPAWKDVSASCLGCGACSYLCPTCYCFDMTAERTPSGSRVVRTWDCCMFPLFTRHASGHNPRPTCVERFRQKIMHKFSYHPGRYGVAACVGCGRCIRSCPAGVDIRGVLADLAKVEVVSP